MNKKIKNKVKQYFIGFLLILIGGLIVNVYKEGKRMWKEVTEINEYTDSYFKRKSETTDKGQQIVVLEERGGATDTREAKNNAVNTEVTNEGSLSQKILKEFNGDKVALAVAKAESGMNPKAESTTDIMADGRPFSVGLYQINLTQHELEGKKCYAAFDGRNKNARVINEELYEKCIDLASNPKIAIKKAKEIHSGSGWYAWGVFTNKSYKKFL